MKGFAILICTLGVLFLFCNGQNTDMSQQKGGTPPPVSKNVIVP